MSLSTPRGPLGGADRAGWFSVNLSAIETARAGDIAYVEPHPRRIVAVVAGEIVIDTERALLVHRPNHRLAYAFLRQDVGDLPCEPEPEAHGFVQVPWDAVDEWYEEGRRLVHYPPNPYHRVDCHATTRRLRVVLGGVVLVDTDDTTIVFETTLEPRLYVNPQHVRTDLLRRTNTTTWCNYKGVATYWAAFAGEIVVDDIAWSYDAPLAESAGIAGYLSFDLGKADVSAELPEGWSSGRP
jgi:uncharacterized protein (DUF427 family)